MILAEPTYVYREFSGRRLFNEDITFIKVISEVNNIESARIILIPIWTFVFCLTQETIKELINANKKIIIDSTYELWNRNVFEKLIEFSNLNNVEYYCNGNDGYLGPDNDILEECLTKGLKFYCSQYFADYRNYFEPVISDISPTHKKFILYTGKTRPERTFIVSLLSYYNLLDYGYVSYFGNDYNQYSKLDKIDNVFKLDEVAANTGLKNIVEEGISKLNIPLKIDVDALSYETAHSKKFLANYYLASDFAVVSETNYDIFFVTEKIIKCINLNKKFIVYGSLNYVKNLKKYYLKNFGIDISHLTDWCNIDYDDEPKKCKRAELIVDEIKRLIAS